MANMNLEEVKRLTAEVSGADIADLDYITEDLLRELEQQGSDGMAPDRSGNYSGNHFVNSGNRWSWRDKVGSQCGTDRTWTYSPVQAGSTVRQAGRCPQGYVWFEMYCVF